VVRRAAEQDRADVARRRARWQAHQARVEAQRLVFLDETWTTTAMARLRGWGRCGTRLIEPAPHGHWRTLTFIAALRQDGLAAPCVFDGPINGRRFLASVEQMLVPALKGGDIVVMDNLGSHKSEAIRRAIRAVGAHLFSCRPTRPTSTPSSRSLPSSSTCCAKPPNEASRPHGAASGTCSTASAQPIASTTSGTTAMLQPEPILL
jgi:DDE superfamily endonuclease